MVLKQSPEHESGLRCSRSSLGELTLSPQAAVEMPTALPELFDVTPRGQRGWL